MEHFNLAIGSTDGETKKYGRVWNWKEENSDLKVNSRYRQKLRAASKNFNGQLN